jgi:peptide/nickel transport system permease protein
MSVVSTTPDVITEGRVARSSTPWWRFPKRYRNPIGIVGAIIVLTTIFIAIFAPLIAPYDPAAQGSIRLLSPSREHLMGTDELGRDTFSRIVYGARVSLQVGIISVIIALAIGGFLGLLSGYFGGRTDTWTMRLVDIMFAFPGIVLAIVIAGLLGPSRRNAMIAIGVIYAPAFARVVRGTVLSVKGEAYIEAARLGTQPPEPTWGGMLNIARTYMEISPWMAIFPGLAIAILVLGFNFLGDGLRDILDPRLRER